MRNFKDMSIILILGIIVLILLALFTFKMKYYNTNSNKYSKSNISENSLSYDIQKNIDKDISDSVEKKSSNYDYSYKSTYSNQSSYSHYNIGDTITTSKFEITVISVEERSTIGTQYFSESAGEGNTYLCFRVKIKNISNEPIGMFSQPSFSLTDSKNITYHTDLSASAYYGVEVDDTSKAISDLNPGVTIYDSGVFQLGKEYYSRNTFKLIIDADRKITVNI